MDDEGFRESLQLDRADGIELVPAPAAGENPDQVGDEDLASRRPVAEAGRLDHRGAEVIALVEGGLPDRDSGPHCERRPLSSPAVAGDGLLDRGCSGDGLAGRREGDHEPIAQVFDLGSSVFGDGLAYEVEMELAH